MIHKTTAAIVLIALAGAVTFSVTGQEEPLPVLTLKTPSIQPTVILAVEPIHELAPPTLAEAARKNDYIAFSSLYAEAVKRGEDVSRFATLHELWSWAITDPIGAFYGADTYEKLSRAYPGFAAYIAQHKIVDQRGNTFYPTSETRAFLLDRALEGRPAPRVQVAETKPAPRPQVARAPRRNAAVAAAGPQASSPAAPKAQPKAAAPDAAEPAGVDAGAPQTAVVAPVPAPVVAQPAAQPVVQTDTAVIPRRDNPTGRGILLVVVGLIGVGFLALILRTPPEQTPVKIIRTETPDNVEPLRKTDAPAAPPAAGTKAS